MLWRRREFIGLAATAAATPARAWTSPSKPIKLVVPSSPGAGPDIVARLVAPLVTERLGPQIIIENRSGAGAVIGASAVARAEPDGHTLLLTVATNVANISIYKNVDFDFARDFAPVASLLRVINALVVHPSVPARTVAEFIAWAKANPGKLNMVSGGQGSAAHVIGELFKTMAGIEMTHVPYASSYYPDLLSGQTQVVFSAVPGVIGAVRAGQLRALAVTSERRWAGLPDIPTVAETLPGYEASGWYGVLAPRATPGPVVEALHAAFRAAIADPRIQARLPELGASDFESTPAEFGAFVAAEVTKWAAVIKAANIRAE